MGKGGDQKQMLHHHHQGPCSMVDLQDHNYTHHKQYAKHGEEIMSHEWMMMIMEDDQHHHRHDTCNNNNNNIPLSSSSLSTSFEDTSRSISINGSSPSSSSISSSLDLVDLHDDDDDDEDDVYSKSPSSSSSHSPSSSNSINSGPLYQLSELMAQLPIKRGLSRYYQGKSQSFTSLSRVMSTEDLAKKESSTTPHRKKNMKSCSNSYGGGLDAYKSSYTLLPKPTITKNKVSSSRGSNSFSSLSMFPASRKSTFLGSTTACCSRPPPVPVQKQF
ncbi:hypothetical protein JRO89_XS09G0189500 [Xanthoceras sorbifolium]|uniref:Uncharacterized protein n=1 Tax=Xanthoceras sorbifolium TaxID=99658 RepID=A0ABQ8HM40_9ROSI|nr:hypothetical protein JRO89_XS09G0189500 [Xanthoceras sorbifolium]